MMTTLKEQKTENGAARLVRDEITGDVAVLVEAATENAAVTDALARRGYRWSLGRMVITERGDDYDAACDILSGPR